MAQTVLVTGATGFLATYVVKAYLDAGYHVRGSVRSTTKAQHLKQLYSDYQDKFELVEVKDIVTGQGLEEAIKGVDIVAHVASPYALVVNDPYKDFIQPAVEGTLSVLKQANKQGIKRVVITSSFAAVTNLDKGGPWRDYTYTEQDWNPTTLQQALEQGKPGPFVYSASKTLAEQAANKFGQEHDMEIVAHGPPLQHINSKSDINTSAKAIYTLISPELHQGQVPWNRLPLFCSVQDVALAHVKASQINSNQIKNQRFLLCGGSFTWEDAILHLLKVKPELKHRLPNLPLDEKDYKDSGKTIAKLDTTKAKDILGIQQFQTWQQVLEQTIDSLLQIEQQWQ
ncbi:hypothetical protein OIO90_004158 [Microbotryomycetes sp. JL221]|nr:hypothetical protein OIO90_004158 [Microbotryomycetes sp. JL221]